MLTPDKINEKSFQTSGKNAYRSDDVDSFMEEVSASYEQMFRENSDLIRKISILAKKIEEYRADEESLKLALLNAQKLADKIVADAKEQAKKEVESVKDETSKLLDDAKKDADELEKNSKDNAEKILSDAKSQAEKIVVDAQRQSDEILGAVNRKVTQESLVYDMIQKEASEFKGKLVSMYKEHINLINKLPEIVSEKVEESEKNIEEIDTNADHASEIADENIEPVIAQDEETDAVEYDIIDESNNEDEVKDELNENVSSDEIVDENAENSIEEDLTEQDTNKSIKKPFKLDLSKIDFADDKDEEIIESNVPVKNEELDENDEEALDVKPNSFKNFFKKK